MSWAVDNHGLDMTAFQSIPENLKQVNSPEQLLKDHCRPYPCKEDGERWQSHKLNLQKCSCGSVWCKTCWPRSRSKRDSLARLSTFSWKRVRHLVLTVNPSLFDQDGEKAWREITFKRGIGNLVKNLERTEGVPIIDWTFFLEWHSNGFPHWHLFIEVEESGKAGMIGVKEIRRYWPWGIWIKEKPIESESHWKSLKGYFGDHGYFEKGKGHQGELPGWAKKKNIRIKRYETKKLKWGISRMAQEETSVRGLYNSIDRLGENVPSKSPMRTYSLILKGCGGQSKLTVITNSSTSRFILPVKYDIVKYSSDWEYVEGKGLTQRMTEGQYNSLIESVTKLQWCVDTLDREEAERETARVEGRGGLSPDTPPLKQQDPSSRSFPGSKVPMLSMEEFGILRGLYEVAPGGEENLTEGVYG